MFDEFQRRVSSWWGERSVSLEAKRYSRAKTGQARVSPEAVEVREEFRYNYSLGKWQPAPGFEKGLGSISILTSTADRQSVDSAGRRDIKLLDDSHPDRATTIGSTLVFGNHGMTDLEGLLAARGAFDSLQLNMPLSPALPEHGPLMGGVSAIRESISYQIEQPDRLPIESVVSMVEAVPPNNSLGHTLFLILTVRLHLPDSGLLLQPRLESIELTWPWLTSTEDSVAVEMFRLRDYTRPDELEGNVIPDAGAALDTTYDTTQSSIVCRPLDISDGRFDQSHSSKITGAPSKPDGREQSSYYSVLIVPNRPIQLINEYSITAGVTVGIESLLSGTALELYSANGYPDASTSVKKTTVLAAAVDMDLDKAMSQRSLAQRNVLKFPGVQPSNHVLETVMSTVISCGYRLADPAVQTRHDGSFGGLMEANRLVGGKRVKVRLDISGHARRVDRTLHGDGGPRLKEVIDAGDVDITLSGTAEGDFSLLTAEMNSLHANLRGRLSTFVEA